MGKYFTRTDFNTHLTVSGDLQKSKCKSNMIFSHPESVKMVTWLCAENPVLEVKSKLESRCSN